MSKPIQPATPHSNASTGAANLRLDAHPDVHLDADQLNAFLEDALMDFERDQTLAHLAICPRCRAIAGLASVEPATPAVVPQRAAAIRPWFMTWRLVWPIAAFATVLLIALNVHKPEPVVLPAGGENTEAKAAIPSPPPVPQLHLPTANTQQSAEKQAPKQARANPAVTETSAMVDSAVVNAPAKAPGSPAAAMPPVAAEMGVAASNVMAAAPAPPPPLLPQAARPATAGLATTVDVQPRNADVGVDAAPSPPALLARAAPLPPAPAALPPIMANPLPSGLPALSLSNADGKSVAIDSAHHPFLSDDGGQHWRPVSAPWPGQAVRVELAVRQTAGVVRAASIGGPLMRSMAAAAPAKPAAAGTASLGGTVMDPSGALMPGATIQIAAAQPPAANSFKASVTTGARGEFLIQNVPPGTYTVTATRPNFSVDSQTVTLAANTNTISNFALAVGSQSTVIEVQSSNADLQTMNAGAGKAVTPPPAPIFEITTDRNETWVSPDGVRWTRSNPPQK